jgi:hypothetical protein
MNVERSLLTGLLLARHSILRHFLLELWNLKEELLILALALLCSLWNLPRGLLILDLDLVEVLEPGLHDASVPDLLIGSDVPMPAD